jgi:5-methylcytosine-specific restriction endonuclease McrA
MSLPVPRWCPRCRRMVLSGRAVVHDHAIRACQACGHATTRQRPRGRPRAARPLGWRRAEAKAQGSVEPDTWQAIVVHYGGLCAHCEERPWTEQDHVVPIARGGQHRADNVVPTCGPCNQRKGTQTWYPRRRHRFMEAV